MTTHAIPTINVNLKQCTCNEESGRLKRLGDTHVFDCPAAPLLLSCPIPRSVTFEVRLEECIGALLTAPSPAPVPYCPLPEHHRYCPARPVKATVDVSGNTWAEIKVLNVERHDGQHLTNELVNTCGERLALVKALVTADSPTTEFYAKAPALWQQRDAVYAALADMARAEQDACDAQQRVDEAFPFDRYRRNAPDHRAERPSVSRLSAYVEHLIEQVGVL